MRFAEKTSKLTACVVALITGGMGVLAYSPFDYWFIVFLSATGLIWLATLPEKRTAMWGIFLWAVAYFAIGVNWVHVSMIQFGGVPEIVSYLAVLLLAAYLALYPLLFGYLVQRWQIRSPWGLAAIFTGTEYLRGVVFTGFPWLQFGYSLIDTPFASLAPMFGVEGLTFLVMVASGYICQIFCQYAKNADKLTACIKLTILCLSAVATQFFQWVSPNQSEKSTSISLVQANIEQKLKWDPAYFNYTLQTYADLVSGVLGKSEVVILPESAIPAVEAEIEPLLQQFHQAGAARGSELIMGTMYRNQSGLFNSAIVLGNSQQSYSPNTVGRFMKHHLVPFGEYVPFGNLLNWMREMFILPVNLSQGDFIQAPLVAGKRRFNMAICYEIIFGHQVQQNQKVHNADYLVTISNDAWFGESIGPWQHFQMARMRALELGKPLVRATNTGITAFVDGYGKVEKQAPQFQATVLSHDVPTYTGTTPFTLWGNWLIYGFSGLILLIGAVRRKAKQSKF